MKRIIFLFTLIICVLLPKLIYPYDGITHSKISEKSYKLSNMKRYLKDNLRIKENHKFNGKTAKEWIMYGAKVEDSRTRMFNHFHNPINNSGLTDMVSGISALTWGTTAGNKWSWDNAREYYYQALTKPTKAERDTAYANMFRSLGQAMHLLQDMAVPAHVRNDAHASVLGVGDSDPYEAWCAGHILSPGESRPLDFSNISDFKIGDFWDAEVYDGSSVPSAGVYKGLSEFTNANFISSDTMFTNTLPQNAVHYQPHPTLEETNYNRFNYDDNIKQVQARDGTWHRVVYLSKDVEGENVEHFVQAGYFPVVHRIIPLYSSQEYELDERCHQDYVNILLPKAVSYSAGLLNYFFKEMEVTHEFVPWNYEESGGGFDIVLSITAQGFSFEGGTIRFYVDDRNERRSGLRLYEENIQLISNTEVIITLPYYYYNGSRGIIVYRGTENNEEIVVGKVVNISIIGPVGGYHIGKSAGGRSEWDSENDTPPSWEEARNECYTNFSSEQLEITPVHDSFHLDAAALCYASYIRDWEIYDAEMVIGRFYICFNSNQLLNSPIQSIHACLDVCPEGNIYGYSLSIYKANSGVWPPTWDCGGQLIYEVVVNSSDGYGLLIELPPSFMNLNGYTVLEARPSYNQFENFLPVGDPKNAPPNQSPHRNRETSIGIILAIEYEDIGE